MVQGLVLTYLVEGGRGSNPFLLFPGAFFGLIAVILLAIADSKSSKQVHRVPSSDIEEVVKFAVPSTFFGKLKEFGRSINYWVYLCIFAGIIGSFWSPMSNFGRNMIVLFVSSF